MSIWDTVTNAIKSIPEAAVLREHVALLRDQFTAMERKTKDLEAKVSVLEAEKQSLALDKAQLQEQIRNLETQLSAGSGNRLEPLEEALLELMEPLTAHIPLSFFTQTIRGRGKGTRIEVALDTLRIKRLVSYHLGTDARPQWGITIEGKRYLIEHGLLK